MKGRVGWASIVVLCGCLGSPPASSAERCEQDSDCSAAASCYRRYCVGEPTTEQAALDASLPAPGPEAGAPTDEDDPPVIPPNTVREDKPGDAGSKPPPPATPGNDDDSDDQDDDDDEDGDAPSTLADAGAPPACGPMCQAQLCTGGKTRCGDQCVDLSKDSKNCGACGTKCEGKCEESHCE
jgi:hypothetical protein